jgi:hypothetical protein
MWKKFLKWLAEALVKAAAEKGMDELKKKG